MKKYVQYATKIILSFQDSSILRISCECPAGAGQTCTCKHVISVLLALSTFVSGGDLPTSLKSCTDVLMTHQRPRKPYFGSPVPVSKFNVNKNRVIEDPRAEKVKDTQTIMERLYSANVNASYWTGLDIAYRCTCIVEVKSPYNGRDEMVVLGQNFAFLDKNKALKKMSDYHFQIQGQLEITKAERCLFVVSTNKDLYVEEIGRDQTFFQRLMLPKLYEFYYQHYIKYSDTQKYWIHYIFLHISS